MSVPQPSPLSPARTRAPRGYGRARLEPTPVRQLAATAVIFGGGVFGWAIPALEPHLPTSGFSYSASAAQATLAAIAGAMITLSGFVVTAITLVVQTVQNMSPRLVGALSHLGHYLFVFSFMVGTALYALVALSQVSEEKRVSLSVTFAVVLVLLNAVGVLRLLGSLRNAVTGGGLSRAVGVRLRQVVDHLYPSLYGQATPPPPPAPTDGHGNGLGSGHGDAGAPLAGPKVPGVIQSWDEKRLVALAARAGLRVELSLGVGAFVGSETPVGVVIPAPDARTLTRLARCARYGPSRTIEQDAAYGFRLLADIAVRALSPAVNDPTTAVQSLDQIEDALVRLAGRELGPAALLDRAGALRVVYPAPLWADYIALALDETLLYGATSPQVLRRSRALLLRLLPQCPPSRQEPVRDRLALVDRLTAALPEPHFRVLATHPDPEGLGGPGTDSTVPS